MRISPEPFLQHAPEKQGRSTSALQDILPQRYAGPLISCSRLGLEKAFAHLARLAKIELSRLPLIPLDPPQPIFAIPDNSLTVLHLLLLPSCCKSRKPMDESTLHEHVLPWLAVVGVILGAFVGLILGAFVYSRWIEPRVGHTRFCIALGKCLDDHCSGPTSTANTGHEIAVQHAAAQHEAAVV